MTWAGAVFTTGWILRCFSTYDQSNRALYIAQTVFIYAGPPIYSAAEYNVLGRLMYYLPMHAPLNPGLVVYFFVYLGASVEGLTAAGASLYATASGGDIAVYRTGGTLISMALVLQAVIECVFISLVALMHHRCIRSGMLPCNVRNLCIMLYGTSAFVLLRCVCRAVESFSTLPVTTCEGVCRVVLFHEWYLYAFEAAPMVLYTYWLNLMHPGEMLPAQHNLYLDTDGRTERLGPGWVDTRSRWQRLMDPMDTRGMLSGQPGHEKFWLQPQEWPVVSDGSLARGSKTDIKRGRGL